jgi:phenylalanyl-tRNA synthetase alpha chain
MTLEELSEKSGKTLQELDASTPDKIDDLFAGARELLEQDAAELANILTSNGGQYAARHEELRERWLSRKHGLLTLINERWLKAAPKPLKRAVGVAFNELHRSAGELFADDAVARPAGKLEVCRPPDLTLPGLRRPLGSLHPITRVQLEIEEIFLNLGFAVEQGPEIESVYYNFDALNIPESHPSRDDWDTLYIDSQTVLRTHTSPVQVRALQKYGAPLYIIIPGKCYRRDNPDATHSPMFHQLEGLAVGPNVTFADLKGTLDFFARRFFGEKTRTSFHPSFFPFTEPSGEVAISCPFCECQGCRVCKHSGWIEVMGCGMVHPEVLRHGGVDPQKYTGWAFGLGIDRYTMMKYGIDDIQLFFQSDLRFLEQF